VAIRLQQSNLEEHGTCDLKTEFAQKVMKSTSLHLTTSDNHMGMLTDVHER